MTRCMDGYRYGRRGALQAELPLSRGHIDERYTAQGSDRRHVPLRSADRGVCPQGEDQPHDRPGAGRSAVHVSEPRDGLQNERQRRREPFAARHRTAVQVEEQSQGLRRACNSARPRASFFGAQNDYRVRAGPALSACAPRRSRARRRQWDVHPGGHRPRACSWSPAGRGLLRTQYVCIERRRHESGVCVALAPAPKTTLGTL